MKMMGVRDMYPSAFSLVSAEDPSKIFAVGVEIVLEEGEIESAVIYRREPDGQSTIGVHRTAEAAQELFSRVIPLTLQRENDVP
jgi:GAF domain-containing protein